MLRLRQEMRVTMRQILRAVLCAAMLAAGSAVGQAQAPASGQAPATAKVEQLAWVAGAWTGTLGDRTIEQHWSAPLGGSIVAMYRSLQAGRATLYELLAMEQEGDGVVLRIKHFAPGPGLVGQEAKDQSVDSRLISVNGTTAVFQGAGPTPVQIRFHSPDADSLNITVTRERNGAPVSTDFRYRRIKP